MLDGGGLDGDQKEVISSEKGCDTEIILIQKVLLPFRLIPALKTRLSEIHQLLILSRAIQNVLKERNIIIVAPKMSTRRDPRW